MIRICATAGEVIDALGGTFAVARMAGRSPQTVSGWRAKGRLAAHCYLILNAELAARQCAAPPELWGIESTPEDAVAGGQAP